MLESTHLTLKISLLVQRPSVLTSWPCFTREFINFTISQKPLLTYTSHFMLMCRKHPTWALHYNYHTPLFISSIFLSLTTLSSLIAHTALIFFFFAVYWGIYFHQPQDLPYLIAKQYFTLPGHSSSRASVIL